MKKIVMLSSLVIGTMLMFSSCEKIKGLTDVDFDADLKADVVTTSEGEAASAELKSANERGYAFEGNKVIDPTSDSKIDKYWKKICQWEIKKIIVKVKSISKDAILKQGQFEIKDESTGAVLLTEEVQDVHLTKGLAVLTILSTDWGEVISALDAQHSLIVGVNGTLDQASVSVTYEVVIPVTITANIFNK